MSGQADEKTMREAGRRFQVADTALRYTCPNSAQAARHSSISDTRLQVRRDVLPAARSTGPKVQGGQRAGLWRKQPESEKE